MLDETTILRAVAGNCGRLRKGRSLTLDGLARRSGISKGMVVEIERGRTNPSIATLCRVANALGVGLGDLLAPPESRARFTVNRRSDARVLWESKHGSRAALVDSVRVGPVSTEVWDWRLAPGEFFDGAPHPAGTTELLIVTRGALRVEASGESVTVRPGTTTRFVADTAHRYVNAGRTACEFQMMVLELPE